MGGFHFFINHIVAGTCASMGCGCVASVFARSFAPAPGSGRRRNDFFSPLGGWVAGLPAVLHLRPGAVFGTETFIHSK